MINISSFKTTKTTNPYNETDEVLELNINDGAVYRLNNVIKVSGTYTFSIWYKTNKNTTITLRILGNESQISSGTSWKKFVKTITVNSVSDQNRDIDIEVASGAIGYFYEAFLIVVLETPLSSEIVFMASFLFCGSDIYGRILAINEKCS